MKSRYEKLSRSIQIQKTYLSNLNKQLLNPLYQNDPLIAIRNDVAEHVKHLNGALNAHLKDCIFYMLYDLQLTDAEFP